MSTAIECEPLQPGNLSELREALESEGMPAADLSGVQAEFFRFHMQGQRLGFAGLEGQGADLLLRSFWIVPGRRDQGIGHQVLEWIEEHARFRGGESLHLLTTTAERFFLREDYVRSERSLAPVSISACQEFQALCPASAVYLMKKLQSSE